MSKHHNRPDEAMLSPVRNKITLISGLMMGVGILLLAALFFLKDKGSDSPRHSVSPGGDDSARFRAQGDLSVADAGASRQAKRAGDVRSEVALSKDESVARLLTEGNKLLAQGKYDEAHACYEKILESNPKSEDAHFNMGILLGRMKKTTEAIRHYEEAIKIMPDYTEAHNNLGNLLVNLGKFDEGIAHFREALRVMPDHAAAHNNVGNALARQGKTMQATDFFLQALKLKPDYVEAHYNLANAFVALNRPEDAAKEFEEVLLLRPGFEPAVIAMERLKTRQSK